MKICSECGHLNHTPKCKKYRYFQSKENVLVPMCEKCKQPMSGPSQCAPIMRRGGAPPYQSDER